MSTPQSWFLTDADELAARHKYTFYKSPRDIIEKVSVGEVVKLIFQFESDDPEAPSAERMWVLVDEIGQDGKFKGRLNNEPRYIKDLKLDDPIDFSACHIINTEHDDDENLVERYIKRCFVTNRVLKDGVRAGCLYREEPGEEKDSGWRITANDESDEYMDDSKNCAYVSLGAVLTRDDSFIHLLDSPIGAAFIRVGETGEFVALPSEG
jgi:hypothetical protein